MSVLHDCSSRNSLYTIFTFDALVSFDFQFNNLRCIETNYFKFMHMARGDKRKAKFNFGLYHFSPSVVKPFFFLFFLKLESATFPSYGHILP